VERSYSDGSAAESFAYDLVGRQTSASNENGTVSTVYDLAGQVTAETGANGKTTTYTYDSRGLRTSITLPDGAVTSYVWDAERRNTEIATSLGNVVFTYDAVGRELTQVRPNGNTVRTSWTPGDQIDRLTTTRMSGKKEKTVSDFDYSYDIVGNVTGLDRVVDSEENTIAYTYDALGRLTGSTSSDKHEENNLYTYDAAGNRVKWIHGTNLSKPTEYATQTNTYDLAGELVASVEEFMYTSTIKKIRSTENTWQAGNLARSVTTAEWATVTKGVTGKTRSQWVEDRRFAYDAEGRLESASQWGVKTTKGVSQDVQCGKSTSGLYGCPLSVNLLKDPPNHGVTLAPARNTLTRQYDALGRLLMENNGGLETNTWTYGGLDPVYAENWTALTKKTAVTELFRDASGNLLGQNMFATKLDGDWFITDALGSVYGAVSKSGSSVHDESSYNDWGVQLEETDLLVAYSGELRDLTQNGLVSFHARTYQPVYALWLQPDPFKGLLEVPGSTCAYTYVLLNPLTMDEFHGYWGWKSVLGAVAGAVVGAVAVVALAAVCVGTVGVGVLWRQRSARLSARR
jgi:RHS repeat-associated protein